MKYITPTHLHMVRNARLHAHIIFFFSVCCYEKSGFYIILCTPFYWAINLFFFIFFLTNVENGREKLGKKSTSFFANFVFRVCHKIYLLKSFLKSQGKLLLRQIISLVLCENGGV